jgi:hypothetical protein
MIGCNSPQSSSSEQTENKTEHNQTQESPSKVTEAKQKSDKPHHFMIVSVERKHEPEYKYSISVQQYKNQMPTGDKKEIDLSQFGGDIMHGKYQASGAFNFPVQLNADQTKAYCSIVKHDAMEGEFDWAKLIEVNLNTGAKKVIAEFSDFFPAWHYAEAVNKIYGYLPHEKHFLAIDTESGKKKLLKKFRSSQKEFMYFPQQDGKIEIITQNSDNKIFQHKLNPKTNFITSIVLEQFKDFSSYKDGKLLEAYKDWQNDQEELRIYQDGTQQNAIPFNFDNFNTFWVNDEAFVCTQEDKLVKINTNLKPMAEFTRKNIRIIDALENHLFISFGEHGSKKAALLSDDFSEVNILKDVDPRKIIALQE